MAEKEKTPECYEILKPARPFKETFLEWCQVTTCAGVIDFSLARCRFGKIFWVFIIAICFLLTLWQTGMEFHDFIYGNTWSTSMTVISDQSFSFPNVTVCNNNRISSAKAKNLSKNGLMYAFTATPQDYFSFYNPDLLRETIGYKAEYEDMMISNNIEGVTDLFLRFGYSCEETLFGCQWGMMPFDCCKEATEVITSNGRCWNVLHNSPNNPQKLEQNFPGSFYGLKLLINPNLDTYMNDIVINSVLTKGVALQVNYYETVAFTHFETLPPGARAWLKLSAYLKKFESSSVPLNKLQCVFNGSLKFSNADYTLDNCIAECWLGAIYSAVECVTLNNVHPQVPICTALEIARLPTIKNMSVDSSEVVNCRKKCLPPCEETWLIKTSLTTSRFLDEPISSDLANLSSRMFPNTNMTKEMLASLINVNIFFPNLEYTLTVTSERNPLFSFVSDVGGQLSLFLGISIITIIQLFYYVVICIGNTIK